ncbi:MAG UNVERIFIED_CONTAM: hypothetical protein LVQ98_00655 [Rickettsiaceae bacterium]|jgi:hypothetical protein
MAQQTGPDLQRGLWAQVASFRPFQFLNSIIKRPQVEQQNGQDLPTDLWAHVASFLPPRDLGALFSVNRSAYAAKFILDLEFIINKLSEQAISNTLLSNEARETLMEKLRIIHQSLPDEYKLEFLNQLRVSICTNNFNFGLQQDMPYVIKTNFIPNIMKLCMYSLNSQGIMPSYEAIKPFFLEADNPKISNIPIIVEQFKRILKQISEGELTTDTVLDYIYNPQIIRHLVMHNNAVVHLENLFSAMTDAPQIVPLLMRHYNGDINKKGLMGFSLLGYAIRKNDIVAGDLLLARSDLVLDPKEDLLMMAILKMDVLWAQKLIKKGQSPQKII